MRREREYYEFTIPVIGYGSKLDSAGSDDGLKIKVTKRQMLKINDWLKRHFKYLKVIEFWQFKTINDSKEMGTHYEQFQYDDELYEMLLHFFPEILYERKLNPIHKFLLRIKPVILPD